MNTEKKLSVCMTLRGARVDQLLAWAESQKKGYTTVATTMYLRDADRREREEAAREKAARLGTAEARLGDPLDESQPSAPESTKGLGAPQVSSVEPSPVVRPAGTPESRLGESHSATSHAVASDTDSPAPDAAVALPATPEPGPSSAPRQTEALVPAEPAPALPASADVDRPELPRLGDHLGEMQVPHAKATSRLGGRTIAAAAFLTIFGLAISLGIHRRLRTPATVAAPLATSAEDVHVALDRIKRATVNILWVCNAPIDPRIVECIAAAKRSAPNLLVTIITDDKRVGQTLARDGYSVFATASRIESISWLAIDDSVFLAASKHGIVTLIDKRAADQLWGWADSTFSPSAKLLQGPTQ